MNKFITSAILLLSSTSLAQGTCMTRPSCDTLGYTKSASECSGFDIDVSCPFDSSKHACGGCTYGEHTLTSCPNHAVCSVRNCDPDKGTKYKVTGCESGYTLSASGVSCYNGAEAIILTFEINSRTMYFRLAGTSGTVDWGDGTSNDYTLSSYLRQFSHTYASTGTYTITFTGNITSITALSDYHEYEEESECGYTYESGRYPLNWDNYLIRIDQMNLPSVTSLSGDVNYYSTPYSWVCDSDLCGYGRCCEVCGGEESEEVYCFAGNCDKLTSWSGDVPPNLMSAHYMFYGAYNLRTPLPPAKPSTVTGTSYAFGNTGIASSIGYTSYNGWPANAFSDWWY